MTTKPETTVQATAATAEIITIQLDTPLRRGDGEISEVTLRKPRSGELRGISLAELLQLQVNSLRTLLPRITTPMLNAPDVDRLEPADLMQLGLEVSSFLLTKADKARAFQTE